MANPGHDPQAAKTIVDLLSTPLVKKIRLPSFVKPVFQQNINARMYSRVGQAISSGKITVGTKTNMPDAAKYVDAGEVPGLKVYDLILLKKTTVGPDLKSRVIDGGNIVHECTHAGFDLLRIKNMTWMDHEVGGYIAGALYGVRVCVSLGKDPRTVEWKPRTLGDASWRCGLFLYQNRRSKEKHSPTWHALVTYLAATILANPEYKKKKMYDIAPNDGVGKAWQPIK